MRTIKPEKRANALRVAVMVVLIVALVGIYKRTSLFFPKSLSDSEDSQGPFSFQSVKAPLDASGVCNSPLLNYGKAVNAIEKSTKLFAQGRTPIEVSKGHQMFEAMGPLLSPCHRIEQFAQGDGAKWFCTQPEPLSNDCVVFSLGSNNEWDFEVAMVARTPCSINTFDCTVKGGFKPPSDIQGRSKQFPYCVGVSSESNFRTLEEMMLETKTRKVAYMKIDVEGHEWPTLRKLLDWGKQQFREGYDVFPEQMAIEVHARSWKLFPSYGGVVANVTHNSHQDLFCLMSGLFREAGYVYADRHDNPYSSSVSELLFVRARCTIGEPHPGCAGTLLNV